MKKKYGYDSRNPLTKEEKLTKENVWKLWSDPPTSKGWKGNSPEDYLVGQERSEYLVNLTKDYLGCNSSILEIGCNVGRNLNYFLENGYSNLSGIEINKNAISVMKEAYPNLHRIVDIFNNPVEECVPKMLDDSYDCVYTMAVLEHIHYNSEFIFDEIKRIARTHIITIEDEKTSWSNRHFPRNYENIFVDENWKQVYHANCSDLGIIDDRFAVRVFMKVDSESYQADVEMADEFRHAILRDIKKSKDK
jgi:SAM-dependent methyltransferase